VTDERRAEVDAIMSAMEPRWRTYWCSAMLCGCIGCVQTGSRGKVTKAEWLDWRSRNEPVATTNEDLVYFESVGDEITFVVEPEARCDNTGGAPLTEG
jgi:hypothetical protein